MVVLAAQDRGLNIFLQSKQNMSVCSEGAQKALLSAFCTTSCSGTGKKVINLPMRANASVLQSSWDRFESFFFRSSSSVVALLQTSEAINKNLTIIELVKLMSLLGTLRCL